MSRKKHVELKKNVAPFENSSNNSSIKQLINTIPPFFFLWFLAYQSLSVSIWLTLTLAVVAAGFMVRTFIIFHDCTHQSFFKNKRANRVLGTITGVITHFPFEKWKRSHSIHHATSGNLDKRGTGDVWVMTVDEFAVASFWGKLSYRLYRNVFVMFGLGPFYLYFISNRFNQKGAGLKERLNTHLINLLLVLIYLGMILAVGWKAFFIIQLPILFVSGMIGIWLFYVQHQFEDSYFESEKEWDYVKAAVDGSSFYKLPKIFQWLSGNIGYHHVHHLSPRVPNYNLEKAHECTPPLQKVTTITLVTSLKSLQFHLYDEKNKTFLSFKDVKKQKAKAKSDVQLNKIRPSFQEK